MTTATARERLTRYLAATGWTPPTEEGPAGGLWAHPNSRLALPVPHQLTEGGLDWVQILRRLSTVEGSELSDLVARLEGRVVDIANLRATNDIVIADTIPYSAGVSMVRESWIMLRSCATTSMGAKAHIGHRYRKSADEVISAARMAHTKKGSFIIPIHLPLPPEPPDDAPHDEVLPGTETAVPESSERRVMRTFAESIAMVSQVAVDPEREPNKDAIHELVRAGVSHEFTAALHRILAQEAVAEFGASFAWASATGPPPATPATVNIPASAAKRVDEVSRKLKLEPSQRGVEVLTGPIVGVRRDDKDKAGVVTIQTVRNGRDVHVNVNVSRDRLYNALDWMKARSTAVIESRVHPVSGGLFADRRDSITLLIHQQLASSDEDSPAHHD